MLFCIYVLFSQTTQNLEYYDTVNVRKDFFKNNHKNITQLTNFNEMINDNGRRVMVALSKTSTTIDVLFAPAYKEKDLNVYGKVVYRFNASGELIAVKVYYLENHDSYVLFKKDINSTYEVYLFGKIIKSNLHYYFDIEKLFYLPLYSMFNLLESDKTASDVFMKKEDYKSKITFIDTIIKPSFASYHNDGALNEFDEFVSINSLEKIKTGAGLNCSGFVKEIYDRYMMFVYPTHKRLPIEILKQRNMHEKDYSRLQHRNVEFTEDPFFGRDWMENLNGEFNQKMENLSVRAKEITSDLYAPYYINRGFNVDDLIAILYRDQIINPEAIYFIAFNTYSRENTLVPKFYHIACIVPYYRGKQFVLRVFESGEETSFITLLKNHLPSYFSRDSFEKDILEKRVGKLFEREIEILKASYVRSRDRRWYNLNRNITDEQVYLLASIFSKLEYREEKVMLYRLDLSYHF